MGFHCSALNMAIEEETKLPVAPKAAQKKNPLKNKAVMFRLNPFAKTQLRNEQLKAEEPKVVKKRKSKKEKKSFRPSPRPEPVAKQKVVKPKKPKKKRTPKPKPEPVVLDIPRKEADEEEEGEDERIFYSDVPSPTTVITTEPCIVEDITEIVETEEFSIEDIDAENDEDELNDVTVTMDIRPDDSILDDELSSEEEELEQVSVSDEEEDSAETDTTVVAEDKSDESPEPKLDEITAKEVEGDNFGETV